MSTHAWKGAAPPGAIPFVLGDGVDHGRPCRRPTCVTRRISRLADPRGRSRRAMAETRAWRCRRCGAGRIGEVGSLRLAGEASWCASGEAWERLSHRMPGCRASVVVATVREPLPWRRLVDAVRPGRLPGALRRGPGRPDGGRASSRLKHHGHACPKAERAGCGPVVSGGGRAVAAARRGRLQKKPLPTAPTRSPTLPRPVPDGRLGGSGPLGTVGEPVPTGASAASPRPTPAWFGSALPRGAGSGNDASVSAQARNSHLLATARRAPHDRQGEGPLPKIGKRVWEKG